MTVIDTPGPGSYLLPSDYGHYVSSKNELLKTNGPRANKTFINSVKFIRTKSKIAKTAKKKFK